MMLEIIGIKIVYVYIYSIQYIHIIYINIATKKYIPWILLIIHWLLFIK